jgi:hypothetical protein
VRCVLQEKIRPIDKKLQYQMDKLLKAAAAVRAGAGGADAGEADGGAEGGEAAAAGGDDPLRYGPRPDALVAKQAGVGGGCAGRRVGCRRRALLLTRPVLAACIAALGGRPLCSVTPVCFPLPLPSARLCRGRRRRRRRRRRRVPPAPPQPGVHGAGRGGGGAVGAGAAAAGGGAAPRRAQRPGAGAGGGGGGGARGAARGGGGAGHGGGAAGAAAPGGAGGCGGGADGELAGLWRVYVYGGGGEVGCCGCARLGPASG